MTSLELIQSYLNHNNLGNITHLFKELQNADYEGYTFLVNKLSYRSRLAKLTPKKKGYFVAFWEKNTQNSNQAYSYTESPDYLIVTIIDDNKKGLFLFPKEILLTKKILMTDTQKGKMAIRVYPTWETELNQTAEKTQNWQCQYFIDLSS